MSTEQLWREMHQSLKKFILSKVDNEQDANDILQEVFLKIQTKRAQLKDTNKIVPWLYQITRNIISDHYRSRSKGSELQDAPEGDAHSDTESKTHEFALCIPAMIQSLPEKYRQAIYLTEIEGLSQKELAEKLDISYSGAKSRVQRGREKLKDALLQCCEIYTDAYGNILDYHPREKKC